MGQAFDVLVNGFAFLESPRWHDGRLWMSDFYTNQVIAVTTEGFFETVVEVPGEPAGLGWLPDGQLLVASRRDRKLLRFDGERLVEHADLSRLASSHLNDMVVDAAGRAYVGHFGADVLAGEPIRLSEIIRVDPDGSTTVAASELHFPNGMVIGPDGSTLIVAETLGNRLTVFDVAADGSLSNQRTFATFGELPDTDDLMTAMAQLSCCPDGLTLDADGGVWAADVLGTRLIRVLNGRITEAYDTSDLGLIPIAPMLGGDDGQTLFLCAAPSFLEQDCRNEHRARVLTMRVEVPHAGHP